MAGNSHDFRHAIVIEKLRFQLKYILSTLNVRPAFLNSFGVKSVFEKLRFRD